MVGVRRTSAFIRSTGTRLTSAPKMGRTPAFLAALKKSTAPNMLSWSVSAMACAPSALARAQTSTMRVVESSIEYSE